MSSTVTSPEGLQQNDYLTVALLTVIAYDYVLTLPREIDHIWTKRWSMVSVLFLFVRYCGLYILIVFTLMWSSLLPGPVKYRTVVSNPSRNSHVRYIQDCQGETLYLGSIWAFIVWIGASDLVMILRVWAIYRRSRLILAIVLTFWVIEVVLSMVTSIMYPREIEVVVIQVANSSYCAVTSASVAWTKVSATTEITSGGVVFILVMFQFVKQVAEMYRVTKEWHFNRYMTLFAGQSVLYFLFIVCFNRTAILVASGEFQTEGWDALISLPFEYLPAFALTPRFIMSVRTLHDDSQDSHGRETDTRFAISGSNHTDHDSTLVLDVRRSSNDVEARCEDIPLEEWRHVVEHW